MKGLSVNKWNARDWYVALFGAAAILKALAEIIEAIPWGS